MARAGKGIVIGAGLAGLAAADHLQQRDYEVQLLEASTRPGGRVLTLRKGFADGLYAEAGAMSFLDSNELVMGYVRELGLGIFDAERTRLATVFDIDGHIVPLRTGRKTDWPTSLHLTAEEQKLGLAGMYQKYLDAAIGRLGNPHEPGWPPEDMRPYDSMDGVSFLRSMGASPGAIELIRMGLLDLDGDGLASYSALFLLTWWSLCQYKQVYVIDGGMDRLPGALAKRLGKVIQYGAAVRAIEQDTTGVTVTYTQADDTRQARADFVVCAIPFTVLRKLDITPALSPAKRKVVAELPITSVVRVFLQTRSKFWLEEGKSGVAFTELEIMSIYPAYFGPDPRGILECYAAGENARRLAGMSEEDRVELVVNEMAQVDPRIRDELECAVSIVWDDQPWALGAYAWYRPGQFLPFLEHLTSPEGRIFFAGDQTSLIPGWMEGALQSGVRAAKEIHFGSRPPTEGSSPQ